MAKLTERGVMQLERIKEKLQEHHRELKSAQRALRRFSEDETLSESPIDLGLEIESDVIVDDLDLYLEDISDAIRNIDTAVEEYDS